MTYEQFVNKIAKLTDVPAKNIRDALTVMPEILTQMNEGEKLHTPIGVFRVKRKPVRMIKPPRAESPIKTSSSLVVKLRPSIRLHRKLD